MKKYMCSIFYEYNSELLTYLITKSLNVLGFNPKFLRIYIDSENIIDDIKYEESIVYSSLLNKPSTIEIKNKIYDQNTYDNFWFRIQIDDEIHKKIEIVWMNESLNFLLDENFLKNFIAIEGFILGFCCENEDMFIQSVEDVDYYIQMSNDTNIKINKDRFGNDVVDTSEHWGRLIRACGLEFMAAPLMWFGENFQEIISKEKLLKFPYIEVLDDRNILVLQMKLFDLYKSPALPENRSKQKEFWRFFDLERLIKEYKEICNENSIKALSNFIKRK